MINKSSQEASGRTKKRRRHGEDEGRRDEDDDSRDEGEEEEERRKKKHKKKDKKKKKKKHKKHKKEKGQRRSDGDEDEDDEQGEEDKDDNNGEQGSTANAEQSSGQPKVEKKSVTFDEKEKELEPGELTETTKKYLSKGGYRVPRWARLPKYRRALFEVSKKDEMVEVVALGNSPSIIFGRQEDVVDKVLQHPSISRQHAAIVHDKHGRLQLIDLKSGHGVYVNRKRIRPHKPYRLRNKDIVTFGGSTRKYKTLYRDTSKQRVVIDEDGEEPLTFSDDEDKEKSKKAKKKKAKEEVRCSHILAKHRGSRRPSSWREKNITISLDEAMQKIERLRMEIVEGSKEHKTKMADLFSSLARKHSDCSSARNGGDLGFFSRKRMQKPFEDASFALAIGELSQPVVSDSGIHIIFRTG
mmetsp:Transcript_14711/g.35893  ORF Transcript_14711/g.35893 Transcript_14711/m.35893 type:complete len:412 (-) Transcript_14711:205-1440(-)